MAKKAQRRNTPNPTKRHTSTGTQRQRKPIIDRIAECGQKTILIYQPDEKSKADKARHVATLRGNIKDVTRRLEETNSPVKICRENISTNGTSYECIKIKNWPGDLLELEHYIYRDTKIQRTSDIISEQSEHLLSQWETAQKHPTISLDEVFNKSNSQNLKIKEKTTMTHSKIPTPNDASYKDTETPPDTHQSGLSMLKNNLILHSYRLLKKLKYSSSSILW